MMRLFVPVFFVAPLGGFHRHVETQVRAFQDAGHQCTVMCKPGVFATWIRTVGAEVVETDYSSMADAVSSATDAGPFDIVHAHPFASRRVGVAVARHFKIPLVLQLHGNYTDQVEYYEEDVDLLLVDKWSIVDLLIENGFRRTEIVEVISNGFDPGKFSVATKSLGHSCTTIEPNHPRRLDVLFASRLDSGRAPVVDTLLDSWRCMQERDDYGLFWRIAGDGELVHELEAVAANLRRKAGYPVVEFLGWCHDDTLVEEYRRADVTVGPSRCVIESMACGTPAIAFGNQGYIGPVTPENWREAAYSGFEGSCRKFEQFPSGRLYSDLTNLAMDRERLSNLAVFSAHLATTYYDETLINRRVVDLLELTVKARARASMWVLTKKIDLPLLRFDSAEEGLANQWSYRRSPNLELSIDSNGSLLVDFDLSEEKAIYIKLGTGSFDSPPSSEHKIAVDGGHTYSLSCHTEILHGTPPLWVWVGEYDNAQKLRDHRLVLNHSLNDTRFTLGPGAVALRLAVRLGGIGSARIHPLQLALTRTSTSVPVWC